MKKIILTLVTFVFLLGALNVFAQNSEAPIFNLQAPNIIKNDVRAHTIKFKNVIINAEGKLEIEGTAQITNYADTTTSKLYITSYTGIKGQGYYLQYPLFRNERTEAFVLEPKQTITHEFKVIEDNFIPWGMGGVEVLIEDEYNRLVHKEVAVLPLQNLIQIQRNSNLIDDVIANLVVGNKKFPPSTGPTFYPESEDMFLELDFGDLNPSFVDSIQVSVYDRNFFKTPILNSIAQVSQSNSNVVKIAIPEKLSPGVYPIEVRFNTNNDAYVPRVYGRFIVGGNMGKTTDVTIDAQQKRISNLTVVVQGNPPDITNPDREEGVKFNAEVTVFDKNGEIIFTQKLDNQEVEIYKNLDISFDKKIKTEDISKVKVVLSDQSGVFDTFEKEFDITHNFNYLNLLYIIGVLILVIVLIKVKHKTVGVVCITLLLLVSGLFVSQKEVFSKSISELMNVGFILYRQYGDLAVYRNDVYQGVRRNGDVYRAFVASDTDELLDAYGVTLNVLQPDPYTCYPKNAPIPVVIDVQYSLCSNTPLFDCEGDSCGGTDYFQMTLYRMIDSMKRYVEYTDIRDYVTYGSIREKLVFIPDGVPILHPTRFYPTLNSLVNLTNEWFNQGMLNPGMVIHYFNDYFNGSYPYGGQYATLGIDVRNSNNVSGGINTMIWPSSDTPLGLNVMPLQFRFDIKSATGDPVAYGLKEIPVTICEDAPIVDIQATCTASASRVDVGEEVTFTITTTGANEVDPIYYYWPNTDSNTNSYTTTYEFEGTEYFDVYVSQVASSAIASCTVDIGPPISCDNSYTEGQTECINGQIHAWTCTESGWQAIPTGQFCGVSCFPDPSFLTIEEGQTSTGPVTFYGWSNDVQPPYEWVYNGQTSTSETYTINSISSNGQYVRSVPVEVSANGVSEMCSVTVVDQNYDNPGGINVVPNTFNFTPNIAMPPTPTQTVLTESDQICPLFLSVDNVASCELRDRLGQTVGESLLSNLENSIEVNGTAIYDVGTYTLWCSPIDDPVTFYEIPSANISCISNPNIREF
jgi:hypothetical protein